MNLRLGNKLTCVHATAACPSGSKMRERNTKSGGKKKNANGRELDLQLPSDPEAQLRPEHKVSHIHGPYLAVRTACHITATVLFAGIRIENSSDQRSAGF